MTDIQTSDVANPIETLLAEIGYRAEASTEDGIKSTFSGSTVFVRSYDGSSIQFISAWAVEPKIFGPVEINRFNADFRFGSLHREDSRLVLQSNFLLDSTKNDAVETLQAATTIFESLISELRTAIEALLKPSVAPDTSNK